MNIDSVKKLIASLEAAGELTIKERIYLYSMKEHVALKEVNAALAAENAALSSAITDIIAERQRQQSVEGWTPEHDDQHVNFEMAIAGGLYAISAVDSHPQLHNTAPSMWPWDRKWWKPTNPRRDLVKAAALIAAEIERIDRAASKSAPSPEAEPSPEAAAIARQFEQVKGVQS